jgi:hypothetical protein
VTRSFARPKRPGASGRHRLPVKEGVRCALSAPGPKVLVLDILGVSAGAARGRAGRHVGANVACRGPSRLAGSSEVPPIFSRRVTEITKDSCWNSSTLGISARIGTLDQRPLSDIVEPRPPLTRARSFNSCRGAHPPHPQHRTEAPSRRTTTNGGFCASQSGLRPASRTTWSCRAAADPHPSGRRARRPGRGRGR